MLADNMRFRNSIIEVKNSPLMNIFCSHGDQLVLNRVDLVDLASVVAKK